MPIAHTDAVFSLIKSLSKAEKRNFKLYVKRLQSNQDVKFVRLFDTMDKMIILDEAILKKKLRGLSSSQLTNLKRHLYSQILKSLRMIHVEKSVSMKIREQMDFAQILYEKGLYMETLKLLERIRLTAEKSSQEFQHMEILELQKRVEERHITRSRSIKNKMEDLIQDSTDQIAVLDTEVKLTNLKIKMHGLYIKMGHAKNEKEHFFVKDYFKSNLPGLKNRILSPFEDVYLQQSQMWYFYILLDFKACLDHASRWVDIFDSNPEMKKKDPDIYMRGLSYCLTSLYSIREPIQFGEYLLKFEKYTEEYKKGMNTTSRILNFIYLNTARINHHFLMGTFTEGKKIAGRTYQMLQKYDDHLDVHRIIVFNYKIAWMYFGARDFGRCITHLNNIIHLQAGQLREDLQGYARLMHLLAHFELGHKEIMEYLMHSVSQFFLKMEDANDVQKLLLEFIKKNIHSDADQLSKEYDLLYRKIKKISLNPFLKRAFQHLDLLSWIESKMQGVTMEAVIREKSQ